MENAGTKELRAEVLARIGLMRMLEKHRWNRGVQEVVKTKKWSGARGKLVVVVMATVW